MKDSVEINLTELDFSDLTIRELPVKVGTKSYILMEASGDSACKYRNAMLACTQLGESGKPVSVKGMADCEPLLVSMCLFSEVEEGEGTLSKKVRRAVPIGIVKGWPDRVQKKFAETIKKISDMETSNDTVETMEKQIQDMQEKVEKMRSAEAALKNGQEDTTDGSL